MTTARLWVQQSSPDTTPSSRGEGPHIVAGEPNNGIFSVAVNIVTSAAGVVESEVPVTILPAWSEAFPLCNTGMANTVGGIDKVTAGVSLPAADRVEGISGPVQVFRFSVRAMAAGTVTLSATNFSTDGFKGVIDYAGLTGEESNYVSTQIVVTP